MVASQALTAVIHRSKFIHRRAGGLVNALVMCRPVWLNIVESTFDSLVAAADGTRQLDLRFDSMNAEGIFKMTAAA